MKSASLGEITPFDLCVLVTSSADSVSKLLSRITGAEGWQCLKVQSRYKLGNWSSWHSGFW